MTPRTRLGAAARKALVHSWGMLLAGLIPVSVLTLGVLKLLSDRDAIWGTLWTAVLLLGVLGWLGVASWSTRPANGLLGARSSPHCWGWLVALKWLVH